jgi:hypothetical protein
MGIKEMLRAVKFGIASPPFSRYRAGCATLESMSTLTEYRLQGIPGLWQFWAEAAGDEVWLAAMDAPAVQYLERTATTGQSPFRRDGALVLVPRALLQVVATNFHQPPLF